MKRTSMKAVVILFGVVCGLVTGGGAAAQTPQAPPGTEPFEPTVGQSGKDVVWVPTPAAVVEKMLDMAKVTPQDFVMDLGSGDGRNIIAAAKRGANGLGVEFNPDMVELSRRRRLPPGSRTAPSSWKATCTRPTSPRPPCWRCSCCRTTSTS